MLHYHRGYLGSKIHMTNFVLRMDIVFSSISFSSLTRNKKPLDPADIGPGGIYHEKQVSVAAVETEIFVTGGLHQKHHELFNLGLPHLQCLKHGAYSGYLNNLLYFAGVSQFHQKKDEATLEG